MRVGYAGTNCGVPSYMSPLEGDMPKESINGWVAIAGFAALAVILLLEGAALSLTLRDRVAIDFRAEQHQPMMRFLFDRIASEAHGNVATINHPQMLRT
jgi:hypothetical protein